MASSKASLQVCSEAIQHHDIVVGHKAIIETKVNYLTSEIERLTSQRLVEQSALMNLKNMAEISEKRKSRALLQYLTLKTEEFDAMHSIAFGNSIHIKIKEYESKKKDVLEWVLLKNTTLHTLDTIDIADLRKYVEITGAKGELGSSILELLQPSMEPTEQISEEADKAASVPHVVVSAQPFVSSSTLNRDNKIKREGNIENDDDEDTIENGGKHDVYRNSAAGKRRKLSPSVEELANADSETSTIGSDNESDNDTNKVEPKNHINPIGNDGESKSNVNSHTQTQKELILTHYLNREVTWFKFFVYFNRLPWEELILYYKSWNDTHSGQFDQLAITQLSPLLWSIDDFLFRHGFTKMEKELNESLFFVYAVATDVQLIDGQSCLCVQELRAIGTQLIEELPKGTIEKRFKVSEHAKLLAEVLPKDRDLYYFVDIERRYPIQESTDVLKLFRLSSAAIQTAAASTFGAPYLADINAYLLQAETVNGLVQALPAIDQIEKILSTDVHRRTHVFWNHVLRLVVKKQGVGIPQAHVLARRMSLGMSEDIARVFWQSFHSARRCFDM